MERLLEESKKEFQLKFGGDEPISGPDRVNKDENLVKRLNFMAKVMHDIPDEDELPNYNVHY